MLAVDTVIARDIALEVFHAAIAACDPARLVAAALASEPVQSAIGLAVGKAALAMARGAGEVIRGIVVAPGDDGRPLPAGWSLMIGAHPEPDARSLAAGAAVGELVAHTSPDHTVLALLSGGASALIEQPAIAFAEYRALTTQVMRAGVAIGELNVVRGALSNLKAGGLARRSPAPIVTLAVSDVIDDDLAVIGSGPTIGPWLACPGTALDLAPWLAARRTAAAAILARLGIPIPAVLAQPIGPHVIARRDRARVIGPMASFAGAAVAALAARALAARVLASPIAGDVRAVAARLVGESGLVVAWGEPTLTVPRDHGEGGRAQQLALELARLLRGTARGAFVAGSDGIDGPPLASRPAPAGAYIDGASWDAIRGAGIDPDRALARRDAGSALAAIGALVVTGPTGINHGDLAILG